jgi:hypothetical protein
MGHVDSETHNSHFRICGTTCGNVEQEGKRRNIHHTFPERCLTSAISGGAQSARRLLFLQAA